MGLNRSRIAAGDQAQGNGDFSHTVKLIVGTPLYCAFTPAFQQATGMSLHLLGTDQGAGGQPEPKTETPDLCRLLHRFPECHQACQGLKQQLSEAAVARTSSACATCFAGLVEIAVPVFFRGACVALLLAGQVFREPRKPEYWQSIAHLAGPAPARQLGRVRKAFEGVPVMPPQRVEGAVRLLEYFAQTLQNHLPAWVLANTQQAPPAVLKAKEYLRQHAAEPMRLCDVARHAGVCVPHFCEVFRRSTGLTFTQFSAQVRVEKAKLLLPDRARRVVEIAFESGFGSLPTFNRVFKQLTGLSPTQFRNSLPPAG